jgi:hypothetical protein
VAELEPDILIICISRALRADVRLARSPNNTQFSVPGKRAAVEAHEFVLPSGHRGLLAFGPVLQVPFGAFTTAEKAHAGGTLLTGWEALATR